MQMSFLNCTVLIGPNCAVVKVNIGANEDAICVVLIVGVPLSPLVERQSQGFPEVVDSERVNRQEQSTGG